MKSPRDLRKRLAAQWENNDIREARLLVATDWPIILPIGKPTASIVSGNLDALKIHLQAWRGEKIGTVIWQEITYRATGEPITIPTHWEIHTVEDWIAAASLNPEAKILRHILGNTAPRYHSLLTRHRSVWKNQDPAEIIRACALSNLLEPACAGGVPLRAISLAGIDTKFFERHRHLVIRLLDLRFDGEATRQGLEEFLGAWKDGDHWLLLTDFGSGLLPFPRLKVRSSDLKEIAPAESRILIVENEKCLHLLPSLPATIVILGAGLNLGWLSAKWLHHREVAYWGDIDTWGLTMLAKARLHLPQIAPLLMNRETFDRHAKESAVSEPVPASAYPHPSFTPGEETLYRFLLETEQNRLEQEFIDRHQISHTLTTWAEETETNP